jgi:SagB-type dehydrogenase family enzyme
MMGGTLPEDPPVSPAGGIGQEFIEKTKYKHLGASGQQRGIYPPSLEADFGKSGEKFDLSSPNRVESELKKYIDERTSVREYRKEPISKDELSYLLWCTQGVKEVVDGMHTLRTVPSAGARHALETLVLVNNVDGLATGIYRYLALEHKIQEFAMRETISEEIARACFGQDFVQKGAVTFIWVAVSDRMTWRYSERGYRYILLDAGHVCQNLYLAAESIGCGVCAVGAYDDDIINKLLGLDGRNKFVIYIAAAGKKK